jgi:hypothetical protein
MIRLLLLLFDPFIVSVIRVTTDGCFTGVPRESKNHISRLEGISDVLTQEAVFEFPTGAWMPEM